MLGKLMKYEIKATARVFMPLYGALIVLAILNKIFYSINGFKNINNFYLQRFSEIPRFIATMSYIMIIVAIFVITMIVMIQRFYKSLLGDEGYLMFTLPVRPWEHIVTKLAISVMWTVLSGIVTAVSIVILAMGPELVEFISMAIQGFPSMQSEFQLLQAEFQSVFQMGLAQFFVMMLAAVVVSTVTGILQVYASISIGQLFNSHKLLGSFGAYLVINMVTQTISAVLLIIFGFISANNSIAAQQQFLGVSLWLGIIMSAVFGVIFYISTHIILTKKLNLE